MIPGTLRVILSQVAASALPVLIFLFALELIDTYNLLTLGRVLPWFVMA
jgi:hypothetical protein